MIYYTHMSIFIESSKTDKYHDGAWVVISRTGMCPVENLWADIQDSSNTYVSGTLSACKMGYKIRENSKAISYTTLRELFIEAFKPHVSDISRYSLHSLRSGCATAAASHGIPDRLLKRHGCWLSESAKDGYVKDKLLHRLEVSQCLGL